jgi:Leucine-rich repeat (LRR) protein
MNVYVSSIRPVAQFLFKKLRQFKVGMLNWPNFSKVCSMIKSTGLEKCNSDEKVNLEMLIFNPIYDEQSTNHSQFLQKFLQQLAGFNLGVVSFSFEKQSTSQNSSSFLDRHSFADDLTSESDLAIIEKLDLTNLNVSVIHPQTFAKLSRNLQSLRLDSLGLREIKAGAFDGLVMLKTLDLKENKLAKLENGVFDSLTSLEKLDLSDNEISELQSRLFASLNKLKVLNLTGNPLSRRSLHERTFEGLVSLKILCVNNTRLAIQSLDEKMKAMLPFDCEIHDVIYQVVEF